MNEQVLFGRNVILEALKQNTPLDKILLRTGRPHGTLAVIAAKARERGIVVAQADKSKLDLLSNYGNHQGVVGLCPAKAYAEIEDILENARAKGEPPFIVMLDGIEDPHNLGAIMRTAEAAGVHGIIIPKHRAVGLTGTVAKVSSGAIHHILVSRQTNLNDAVAHLKTAGLWVACADQNGRDLFEVNLTGPIVMVVGAEGRGVSRLMRQNADFLVKIPMYGQIDSLNASVAAGILLYETVRCRRAEMVR